MTAEDWKQLELIEDHRFISEREQMWLKKQLRSAWEQNEKLEKALQSTVQAIEGFPKDCLHGEEPWYCDSCKNDWERGMKVAVTSANEALASEKQDGDL